MCPTRSSSRRLLLVCIIALTLLVDRSFCANACTVDGDCAPGTCAGTDGAKKCECPTTHEGADCKRVVSETSTEAIGTTPDTPEETMDADVETTTDTPGVDTESTAETTDADVEGTPDTLGATTESTAETTNTDVETKTDTPAVTTDSSAESTKEDVETATDTRSPTTEMPTDTSTVNQPESSTSEPTSVCATCSEKANCVVVEDRHTCVCKDSQFVGADCDLEKCAETNACVKDHIEYCHKTGTETKVETCVCKSHFWDTTCSQQSDCGKTPDYCKNEGKCVTSSDGKATCECVGNFVGPTCELAKCTGTPPITCVEGSTLYCSTADSKNTCKCKEHNYGATCEQKSDCGKTPDYCKNEGKCVTSSDGKATCECVGNFVGPTCELAKCTGTPPITCVEGSTLYCSTADSKNTCKCKEHNYGATCEQKSGCITTPDQCKNSGKCVTDGDGKATCECVENFVGPTCELAKCTGTPPITCVEGGTLYCSTADSKNTCKCKEHNYGATCEQKSGCITTPDRCKNSGKCVTDGDGKATCECVENFVGPTCELAKCTGTPPITCVEGGTLYCSTADSKNTCKCKEHNYGATCEQKSGCITTPDQCKNSGKCVTDGDGKATCECVGNFVGPTCELAKCTGTPPITCVEGGTLYCSTADSKNTCKCKEHNYGATCEQKSGCITTPDQCKNSGKCVTDGDGKATCECVGNFVGPTCELAKCTGTPPITCVEGGTLYCSTADSKNTCKCKEHNYGATCEQKSGCITTPDQCKNSGKCVTDGDGKATCECVGNFVGPTCELAKCTGTPPITCVEGSTLYCSTADSKNTCKCKEHYYGATCDQKSKCLTEKDTFCKNGATCETNDKGEATCKCDAEHVGDKCEFDACDATMKAECEVTGSKFCEKTGEATHKCHCKEHYSGEKCATKSKCLEIATKFCKNEGVCKTDEQGKETCDCSKTTKGGPTCNDETCANPDTACKAGNFLECYQKPGATADSAKTDTCVCKTEWQGPKCESMKCKDGSKCKNGAVCEVKDGKDVCTCVGDWRGVMCETATECANKGTPHCQNGGTCTTKQPEGTASCKCPDTHVGPVCDKKSCSAEELKTNCGEGTVGLDYCEKKSDGTFQCHCKTDYFGAKCSIKSMCSAKDPYCKNGGKCEHKDGKDVCECVNDYHGETCHRAANQCLLDGYCKNDGTCKRVDNKDKCECKTDFSGDTCEMGKCSGESPCKNNGVCYTLSAAPTVNKCKCRTGFSGDICVTDIDECAAEVKPCKNGGTCKNKDPGFDCTCTEGFHGETCEEGNPCKINKDYCNGGSCVELGASKAECKDCKNGFWGPRCDKGPCDSLPCGKHGTCEANKDKAPYYKCTCTTGWTGDKCDQDVDECTTTKPCKNEGLCSNSPPGAYSCACQQGFEGVNCERDIDECTKGHDCDKGTSAKCNNVPKKADNLGYTCECSAGMIGNGLTGRCQANEMLVLDTPVTLEAGKDSASETLEFGIPIGQGKLVKERDTSLQRTFEIGRNGFISTGWEGGESILATDDAKKIKICAGYMTKLVGGTITYSLYTKENSRKEKLADIVTKIKANLGSDYESLQPEVVLCAKWEDVTPDIKAASEKTTFQICIVSDAKTSLCIVHHQPAGNSWAKNTDARQIFMAFSDGSGDVKTIPGSLSAEATNVDIRKGHNDKLGLFVFQAGKIFGDTNNEYDCYTWSLANAAKQLPVFQKCPYTYEQCSKFGLYKKNKKPEDCCPMSRFETLGTKNICCYSRIENKCGPLEQSEQDRGFPISKVLDKSSMTLGHNSCCLKSGMCHSFNKIVPISTSKNYKSPSFEASIGDPHISTLDGRFYTFNGKGEYWLLKTVTGSAESMSVQCQTDAPGSDVKATVFTGFVMQAKDSSIIQVQLNAAKNGMDITVKKNPQDDSSDATKWTTVDFATIPADDGLDETLVGLTKSGEKELTVAFANGFEFKIGVGVKMLTITTMAPQKYKTTPPMMEGLMGNYDGDKTNEFKPNSEAAALVDTSTDQQIFENFGKTWAIASGAESLFHYPTGTAFKGHVTEFVPIYLDNYKTVDDWKGFLGNLYEDGNTACSKDGKTLADILYKLCMFDIGSTKDVAVGASTSTAGADAASAKTMMENRPPEFKMTSTKIEFKLNEAKTVNIPVIDPDEGNKIDISFAGTAPSGASLADHTDKTHNEESNHAKLTWTPTNTDSSKFQLLAKDDKGGQVTQLLQIRLNHCLNGGTAKFTYLDGDDAPTNPDNFFLAKCECVNEFSGESCEIKPCDRVPSYCYKGVECTFNAGTQKTTCGDCPKGMGGDGKVCTDIDECVTNKGGCEFNCVNSIGSFSCTCNTGMQPNPDDKKKCIDIDECKMNTHTCSKDKEQVCENKAGGYLCVCRSGFVEKDSVCVDVDECLQKTDNNCDKNAVCKNTHGAFTCTCKPGFAGDGTVCADINECLNPNTNNCQQTCMNIDDGSAKYKCLCKEGYELQDDDFSCKVNPNNVCPTEPPHGCGGTCVKIGIENICSCAKGEKLADDKKACAKLTLTELCVPLGCKHDCGDDGNGGPKCTCRAGFKLMPDQTGCEDVDECTETKDGKPLHDCAAAPSASCTNKANGENYTCTCNDGYTGDGKICQDINECDKSPCDKNAVCVNQPGVPEPSESCSCRETFAGNGVTCSRATASHTLEIVYKENYKTEYSNIKSKESQALIRQIISVLTALFKPKYSDQLASVVVYGLREGSTIADVNTNFKGAGSPNAADVQKVVADASPETNGKCMFGGREIVCNPKATDFDECAAGQSVHQCPSSTLCSNTPTGTHSCKCKPGGFKKTGEIKETKDGSVVIEQCVDLDECATMCKKLGTTCTNLPGSYTCDCPDKQWSSDPNTIDCKPACDPNPCQNGECSYSKANSKGGFHCACPEHYTGTKCEIVDPQYADMRTTAIVIGVVFGLLILFLLILLFCICKKRRKGSQPVHKGVGADGRPVLLDDYETGSIPRAKRDPERQHYEMSENSPNRSGVDNPAFKPDVKGQKQDAKYENEYF